ncbi:hypothetical protein GCM10010378_29760 [Streptomyces viridochromogenes]
MHPGRPQALLQEAGVVDDQHGVSVAEVFHYVVAYVAQDLVCVPLDPVQQPVDAIGTLVPGFLRQRPAVLPLQRCDQASHVSERRLARLFPVEPVHELVMQRPVHRPTA